MPESARESKVVEPSNSSDRAPAYVNIQRKVICLGDKGKETVWGPVPTPKGSFPSGRLR